MSDRRSSIDRAILATATAYVMSHHGSGAQMILRERLHHLCNLRGAEFQKREAAAADDLATVITAAERVCGMTPTTPQMGDPAFYLRNALQRYFARQSQRLAETLGLVGA